MTINGSITINTTYVAGRVEEITSNGSGTTLTKYFAIGDGLPTAERVGTNGPLSYLASGGLGSVTEALNSSGTATSAQLYSPYGGVRYSSGTMPTAKGFTGQYSDAASTGLDYYGARYYDPMLGQFTSADSVNDGLNRYGYVKGNPTTYTDPTGHKLDCAVGCGAAVTVKNPPQKCRLPTFCLTAVTGTGNTGNSGGGQSTGSKPSCSTMHGCTGTYFWPC